MPVIKRHYWAETYPNWFMQDLDGGVEHAVAYSTSVPTSTRVLKVVCSFGISVRGGYFADIDNLGLPMSWHHAIVMHEPGSDRYPSGRYVELNHQAGALRMSQVNQPQQLVDFSGTSKVINSKVVTTYSADIEQIDQSMSYGSVDQDIGARDFYASFTVHGAHGTSGGAGPPYYKYSASGVLRVLFERNFTDTGGPWYF